MEEFSGNLIPEENHFDYMEEEESIDKLRDGIFNYNQSHGSRKASVNCPISTAQQNIPNECENRENSREHIDEDRSVDAKEISVIEKDDYRYIGEVKCGLREGFGVCYYTNGSIYIGQWLSDSKTGWGKLVYEDGSILQGEVINNEFNGYCEKLPAKRNNITQGYYSNDRFTDYIIVKDEHRIYEGEIKDSITNKSIGKLINANKPEKLFMGEIRNYHEEDGFGIFLIKSSYMYYGEQRNGRFINYIEMYTTDGASFFGFLKKGLKHYIGFSFSKDGRVSFGKYYQNAKNGPFVIFSNCLNLNKASVKMELYHLDVRSKTVDKMEAAKKYIFLNYPEYANIFSVNYNQIIGKLNSVNSEEMAYFISLVKDETSGV